MSEVPPSVKVGRPRLGLQRIVSRQPTHAVERVGAEQPGAFPAEEVWRGVRQLYRHALHPAIALHVRHRGRVVLDRTIGHVSNPPGGSPGAIATPATLFNLFSASKIVTSALVLALADDGLLSIDDPVVAYVPEFGRHEKGRILVRHLLQHTAGIPDMPKVHDVAALLAAGGIDLEHILDLRPISPPGAVTAYHSLTGWFVIQEILERVSRTPLRPLLRRRLLDPLGIAHMDYGVRPELLDQVARHAVTGLRTPAFMASIFQRNIGASVEAAIDATNDPAFLQAVLPSANVIGTPSEVGRFMQMLLQGGELEGTRVLSEAAVRRMTTDVTRPRLDGTFLLPMRYGLGVMMGGTAFSLFGLNTAGAYGHLGLSNVVVYADPSRELAVAFLNTGKPMLAPGMVQWYAVLQRIANLVPRTAPRSR